MFCSKAWKCWNAWWSQGENHTEAGWKHKASTGLYHIIREPLISPRGNMTHTIQRSSQYGGCWWTDVHLVPGHPQPPWWRRAASTNQGTLKSCLNMKTVRIAHFNVRAKWHQQDHSGEASVKTKPWVLHRFPAIYTCPGHNQSDHSRCDYVMDLKFQNSHIEIKYSLVFGICTPIPLKLCHIIFNIYMTWWLQSNI